MYVLSKLKCGTAHLKRNCGALKSAFAESNNGRNSQTAANGFVQKTKKEKGNWQFLQNRVYRLKGKKDVFKKWKIEDVTNRRRFYSSTSLHCTQAHAVNGKRRSASKAYKPIKLIAIRIARSRYSGYNSTNSECSTES